MINKFDVPKNQKKGQAGIKSTDSRVKTVQRGTRATYLADKLRESRERKSFQTFIDGHMRKEPKRVQNERGAK